MKKGAELPAHQRRKDNNRKKINQGQLGNDVLRSTPAFKKQYALFTASIPSGSPGRIIKSIRKVDNADISILLATVNQEPL